MSDPWVLFEHALAESGERRIALLQSVLRELETTDIGAPVDPVELAAWARCYLVSAGVAAMTEAVASVDRAEAEGRAGWPNDHLAEVAVHTGEHRLALDRLRRIPPRYFEELDLFWRTVRCWELEAIAHIALGDWPRANQTVPVGDRAPLDPRGPPRTGDLGSLHEPRRLVCPRLCSEGPRDARHARPQASSSESER